MVFGGQNSFKIRSKLVEKLFFFLCLLFLVPRRSFDGFEVSFRSFSLVFGELGAQKLWFLHRKRALFQARSFVLLAASDRCLGALRLILWFAKTENEL